MKINTLFFKFFLIKFVDFLAYICLGIVIADFLFKFIAK
jgi:hypothetical protein